MTSLPIRTSSCSCESRLRPRILAWGYASIALIFFCYVAIRAFSVGVIGDETGALSLTQLSWLRAYVPPNVSANNHIVNTFAIKFLFSILGGHGSLTLARLPNVLSFLFYLYFSYKISRVCLAPAVGIGCFFLLVCNPFVLDFFSLARGYGLSLAFMMSALYFGLESRRVKTGGRCLALSLTLAGFSVLSILSMVYFGVGLALAVNYYQFSGHGWASLKKSLGRTLVIGLSLLAAVALPLFRLVKYGELYYGGNRLFEDSLLSLVRSSMYQSEVNLSTQIVLGSALAMLAIVVVAVLIKNKGCPRLAGGVLAVVTLPVILMVLARWLFGILLPIDRNILFLYPLSCICICLFCEHVRRPIFIILPIVFFSAINLVKSANFNGTALWCPESVIRYVLDELNERGRRSGKVVRLSSPMALAASISYYERQYPFVEFAPAYDWEWKELVSPENFDYYIHPYGYPSLSYEVRSVFDVDSYDREVFLNYADEGVVVFMNIVRKSTD